MTQFRIEYPEEIVAVSVRRNWRGKLVLQASRRLMSHGAPGDVKEAGRSRFKDADANNPAEVAEIMTLLKGLKR